MLGACHQTVIHMLIDAAAATPDREALVCDGDRVDYRRYAGAVEGFARELTSKGMAGRRIAILAPNGPDLPIAILGTMAAGAQAVPLNPAFTVHELEPILADAEPSMIVTTAEVAGRIAPLIAKLGLPAPVIMGSGCEGRGGRRLIDMAGDPDLLTAPDPDSPGLLQYTGGTTGRPKGVILSNRAIAVNVAQREALVPTTDGERVLVMTPLYHIYALAMGLFLSLNARATMVLMAQYNAESALAMIEGDRITFFAGSPTIYHGLLSAPQALTTDFRSLRLCFSGASALPEATLRRWKELTGASICEGYGQTEAGPVLASNPRSGPHRAGSVGVVTPGTSVEIVDAQDPNRVLPVGEEGEIRARGPQLMQGYRNRPDETADALRDGWLYTGDIGCFDGDGYLHIRDRKKDMVVVSGYNVYPREIEDTLLLHERVREAAVYGVPHPRKGEAVHAVVVGDNLDIEDLRAFLAERLVRYKLPAHIAVASTIPKTPIGKIDKAALRKRAVEAGDEN